LGQSRGFSLYLEDVSNNGSASLQEAANKLVEAAAGETRLGQVRGNTRRLESQLNINIDHEKAGALGVDLSDANKIISTAFAGSYVNDFILNGEIKPVYIQADSPYRMQPQDINRWYARNDENEMVPFSAIVSTNWAQGPPSLRRFNGTSAVSIQGEAGSGTSSGNAMDAIEELVSDLTGGYTVSWSGLSYQERLAGSQASLLYAVSALAVFLCLAALYESWSVPFAVMLSVPVGVFGALIAAHSFGQQNDVYFKVGLLITIGLTARNAILIVEFATAGLHAGAGGSRHDRVLDR